MRATQQPQCLRGKKMPRKRVIFTIGGMGNIGAIAVTWRINLVAPAARNEAAGAYRIDTTGQGALRITYWAVEPKRSLPILERRIKCGC